MRVLVTGPRTWSDVSAIRRELKALPRGTIIVHGDCAGADEIAGRVGAELGLTVREMQKTKADRDTYGRNAWQGLNERMLAEGVDLVLAFHPNLDSGIGTKHMVQIARAAGVEVRVFTS